MKMRERNGMTPVMCMVATLFAASSWAGPADSRVTFRECPKCDKRIRIDLAANRAYVNLSRLEGADTNAVAARAARLLDAAKIPPARDVKRRPLMGWSSWNTFGVDISEAIILETARAMATNGLKDAGYTYVNIDDGFFWGHGEDGILRFHPERFPNGMKPVVDGIHALGLKAGIYSDAGADTCGSMWGGSGTGGKDKGGIGGGLYGHDAADCKLHFNDLGFDFIKVDYCGAGKLKLNEKARYTEIANAIKATGRTDVRLNLCRWAFPGTWAADIAESWRTTEDIRANWKSVKKLIGENLYLSAYAKPGHYNDMDMLEVGQLKGAVKSICGKHGDTGLTPDEETTHFGMWCMLSSPLLIGCDVRTIPAPTQTLITNPYLLAVNQNDLGCQAYVVQREGDAYVLVKDADVRFGTSRYVALYNGSDAEHEFTVRAAALDLGGAVDAFDLVEMADVGRFEDHVSVKVAPHASKFYRFDAERRLVRKVYEAETAFLTDYQELFDATKAGTAFPDQRQDASGGVIVRYIGNRATNDLIWPEVKVEAAGDYVLSFGYASPDDRAFDLVVDQGAPVRVASPSTGGKMATVKARVRLTAGMHAIRLFNASAWMPDIDRMTLEAEASAPSSAAQGADATSASLPKGKMICQDFAQTASDGTLLIDSSAAPQEFGWRRYALTADDFVPGERYRITFRARVEGYGQKAFLYVLVRPKGRGDDAKDVGSLSIKPTDGKWKSCEMKFEAGGEKGYRLQFHGWNRLKAEIADLKIEKRPALAFVPADATSASLPVSGAAGASLPANLPCGAKEFEVDAPRNATGPTLDCADYGVSETNRDNTAALRAAFADAKAKGAAKLVLARGRYALNTDSPLMLDGFRDFTFDGGGSVFVSYRHGGAFLHLRRSLRTEFKNFSLDWDWSREPLASIVRVKRVDAKSFDLEFVDYADFPNKKAALTVLSAYDPKTRSVGIEDGITRYLDMNKRRPENRDKWLDGRTVRIAEGPNGMAVGQLYRAQHYYYHYHGFNLVDVEHLTLRNVTVLSTPGHAFVMSGKSHHVAFDGVNIVPPKDDPKRVITCTADHLHIAQSRGFIKLENCEFSLGADDIMNMHDNSAFVHRTGPRTVRALNASALAAAQKGDRMEFRNGDYSPTGFFGTFVEAKRIPERRNGFDVTFAEDLPEETKDGFILFNWAFDTHNVIVRNCTFHDNRARALLILARDVTVENNVFRHHEMGAIKIETGYTYNHWSEGYGVSNVVIRGNLFDTVNPSGSYASHRQRSIYTGIYLRTDPSSDTTDYPIIRDILIDGNVFRDNTGVTAYLSSVSNVVVRGNVIEDPTPRRKELPFRSQFFLTNARDIRIVGNTYRASPNVRAPGVAFDPENCAGIVVDGNRIE